MKSDSKRIEYIDFIKGICIFLMVLGHTRSPFTSFIYLFHMAVFFMVTGYLWNGDKYVSISGETVRKLR